MAAGYLAQGMEPPLTRRSPARHWPQLRAGHIGRQGPALRPPLSPWYRRGGQGGRDRRLHPHRYLLCGYGEAALDNVARHAAARIVADRPGQDTARDLRPAYFRRTGVKTG